MGPLLRDIINKYNNVSLNLRIEGTKYIEDILKANGNKIKWDSNELGEFVAVSYDGGNHPEYASNVYSTVYSINFNEDTEEVYLEIEDTQEYSIDSITTEELCDLCSFISCHIEDFGLKDVD